MPIIYDLNFSSSQFPEHSPCSWRLCDPNESCSAIFKGQLCDYLSTPTQFIDNIGLSPHMKIFTKTPVLAQCHLLFKDHTKFLWDIKEMVICHGLNLFLDNWLWLTESHELSDPQISLKLQSHSSDAMNTYFQSGWKKHAHHCSSY